MSNREVAIDALEKGIAAIPLAPGTKTPLVKWKVYQTMLPTREDIERMFAQPCNIALVATGMVTFDCDDADKVPLVLEQCGDTPDKVKTPRGVHLTYRARAGVLLHNQVKIKGLPIDIRVAGGLRIIPNSFTEHGRYEWLGELHSVKELPVARIGWTQIRKRKRMRQATELSPSRSGIVNPEAYCLKIQSVQGSNGSKALVRVVCILRDAGRTPEQTFDFLFGTWNAACAAPPWSEGEILHAITRHYGKT